MSSDMPPLPGIQSDVIRARVFSHRSIAAGVIDGEEDNTNERLSFLGNALLSGAITKYLFLKFPLSKTRYLTELRIFLTMKERLSEWSSVYDLAPRMQHAAMPIAIQSQTSRVDVFQAYLAAIALDQGTAALESWVTTFLNSLPASTWPTDQSNSVSLYNKVELDAPLGAVKSPVADLPVLPPPGVLPIMPYSTAPTSPGGSPPPLSKSFVSQFNEVAQARHEPIAWDFKPSGPEHERIWGAHLLLNGKEVGFGEAVTKQTAKNVAALLALEALGWPYTP